MVSPGCEEEEQLAATPRRRLARVPSVGIWQRCGAGGGVPRLVRPALVMC